MPNNHYNGPFPAYVGSEPYIFVSYLHDDSDRVFPDIRHLHQEGFRIWYDDGIPFGSGWQKEVAKAIFDARVFMVFISPRAILSENVLGEMTRALNFHKTFIPVLIEETQFHELDPRIDLKQGALRYKLDEEAFWRKLIPALPAEVRGDGSRASSSSGQGAPGPVRVDKHRHGNRWAVVGPALALLVAIFLIAGGKNSLIAMACRVAAEVDSPTGMRDLGDLYLEGKGVAKDHLQALVWFQKAAEAGDPEGMMDVGFMYSGGRGVKHDDTQAASWYRRAGEAGNVTAMVNLGNLYEEGRGVKQDDSLAAAWYGKAAEAGNTDGMRLLANMYEEGRGVPKDHAQAVNWASKAAEAGFTEDAKLIVPQERLHESQNLADKTPAK
jgi:hypothetical protein